ncbi:VIR protein [Plasmodium vivax]|uniref:VIR protein n=1 Tax=Plasmodium vivax TaxID=5855 RepID=A0A1G4E6V1_PLAVI|nr:VIR protein [Plasmodium vivax]
MFSYSNTFDSNFLEQALNELKVEPKREISFRNIFKELQKYLNQDGILGYDDVIRIYSIQELLNCLRNLKINYENIKIEQKYNSVPDCQVLSAFVYLFKDFIRVINDNGCDIIKNKLTNFIDVIKKHKWATEEVCSNKLSEITSQKLDSSEKKEVPVPHNPALSFQSTSISSSHPQSVIGADSLPRTYALESSETQPPSRKEPAKETMSPKGSLQFADTQDNLVTLRTTEEEPSTEVPQPIDLVSRNREQSTLKARDKPHEQYTRNLLHIKGQYDPKLSSHQGILQFPNTENEISVDKGYLRRVTDAVSGFMEGVDPVPVVGVSGGMGALFLLFRYTPVGTFFRGRGYRQRIPTRFDGVYTGFMTDFQGDGFFPNNQYNIAYGAE